MKVSAERLNQTRAQVTVEIPEEEFESSLQKAYRIVVKKVNVPGFRKGKAPRRILENIYGKEVLLEEALQDAVPRAYLTALLEVKDEFTAVGDPHYEMVQTEIGKPIIFKAAFDIKPEVKLGQYKGIELKRPSTEITSEDVEKELARIQQRYAKLTVVEGPAVLGDVLTIDFSGTIDGKPFAGGHAENYLMELGSKSFIEGFEEQLVGVKKDETLEVKVTFPEDYDSQELAGKEAVFTVTVKEIKRKELAPLDDEFAKDVSDFSTMQELRQDIENKLKEAAEKRAEQEVRAAAIKKVTENAEVEIPQSMIEKRVIRMIEDFAMGIQQQGISLEHYLKATNNSIEQLKETYRPAAQTSVKTDLVLEALAKAENIEVSPADVDKELDKMAELYKQEPAKLRDVLEKQGQISSLEFGIMIVKAVDFIIAKAQIT